ncbi:hydrolase [Maribacter algarum]|uniref:Hydrolase n=1 Tax=Maribacter algarum (ex Zhang et al. 2020) TaxID=2578118 RepID=A0A5S3PVI2_9FLAO|nr:SGNH/GDSL hydrolase family protein [Maribacter algarum]TMM59009.1 hydrolase [Maribacter algarum]
MNDFFGVCLLFVFVILPISAQETNDYSWHNPLESLDQIDGQGWSDIGYNRLPDAAENVVRKPVWSLSRHAAGLAIRFKTDADSLQIEYEVDGNHAMNHMPATGVSGVDLYGKNEANEWLWYRGDRTFGDTVQFHFKTEKSPKGGREYQLYLPLYNNCKNLRIGIPKGSKIKFLPQRKEKPIVVYGTSIAQGACASRPGMAWTNILGRKLDCPVVNLGFSGNGRLEQEVLKFVAEVDAMVYVLDCLPNLSPNEERTEEEIKKRLRTSIRHIRTKRPNARILLTHHAGYSDGDVDSSRKKVYETLNRWTSEVFIDFQRSKIRNLYLLPKSKINLSNDAFVDGTHPTDLGMEQYAKAYEEALSNLLRRY